MLSLLVVAALSAQVSNLKDEAALRLHHDTAVAVVFVGDRSTISLLAHETLLAGISAACRTTTESTTLGAEPASAHDLAADRVAWAVEKSDADFVVFASVAPVVAEKTSATQKKQAGHELLLRVVEATTRDETRATFRYLTDDPKKKDLLVDPAAVSALITPSVAALLAFTKAQWADGLTTKRTRIEVDVDAAGANAVLKLLGALKPVVKPAVLEGKSVVAVVDVAAGDLAAKLDGSVVGGRKLTVIEINRQRLIAGLE